MSAYIIGNYTVHDPDRYMEYVQAVRQVMSAFGGTTIVADYEHHPLEGKPSPLIVVVEFKSIEAAENWYRSDIYQNIAELRKKSCTGWILLCKGINRPQIIETEC